MAFLMELAPPARFRVNFVYAKKFFDAFKAGNVLNLAEVCGRADENGLMHVDVMPPTLLEDQVEVMFDVRCPAWEEYLFELARAFQIACPSNLPYHLTPVLTVPAKQVFKNNLITHHDCVPLHAVYFGNFINKGLLMVHWEISYYLKPETDLVRQKEVMAEFTHDESFATFRFQALEYKKNSSGKNTTELFFYALKFFYKFVKRVVVDICAKDEYLSSGSCQRVHFILSVPVQIRKMSERQRDARQQNGGVYGDGDRYLEVYRGRTHFERPQGRTPFSETSVFSITFKRQDEQRLREILSRIYHHSGCQIEFANVALVYGLLTTKNTAADDSSHLEYEYKYSKDNMMLVRQLLELPGTTFPAKDRLYLFPLWYLIEGLLSRGTVVKDQLLLSKEHYQHFLKKMLPYYRRDKMRCEWALEELMDALDEQKEMHSIVGMFEKLVNAPKDFQERLQREQVQEGYVRCRKVVITPSRMIFIPPEVMMGNRVIRTKGTEREDAGCPDKYKILRVSFRDDDGGLMRRVTTGDWIISSTIEKAMGSDGILVGGFQFTYLGNSNSQMRDHGCYFYMGKQRDAEKIRMDLGRFWLLPNIAKIVARLGQCFTQSRETHVELKRLEYETVCDFIGGCDSKEKEFTYSDGVGRVSEKFLASVSADLKLGKFIPSCIQFRFRGGKGVLTMDPVLDADLAFAASLGYIAPTGFVDASLFKTPECIRLHKVMFRESQMKFVAPRSDMMEVVKYSAPTPVSLNRPFINILDQVSEMQSRDVHRKVCKRIEMLLDRHLRNVSMVLIDEKSCRNKLKELPHRLDTERLSASFGFQLSVEPFFRSLVKACVRYALQKQLHKEQIQIPHDLGRSMFGVVDETGLLQYGQIFCRYTVNLGLKNPTKTAASKILKGRVLITKNPCIVSGDVRIFEAVDVPQLRHLRDVVVFPRHGPRPHPDEMAGSDLDGDEYSIIWDPELMFNYNMNPMDFAKTESTLSDVNAEEITNAMVQYYIGYMSQDQVGMVANAHLIGSDLYGLDSTVARGIAQKHSEAVDFPKTGVPPKKLTTKWQTEWNADTNRNVEVPPEKSNRAPDFMEKDHEPVFRSMRMIGKIYREVKMIEDILAFSEERDAQLPFELDPLMHVDGWEEYRQDAEQDYGNFCAALRREMDHYGIRTEAELLTGCILEMRNRLSDKDNDDMSFFNTTHTIEQKVNSIWVSFRENFFEKTNRNGKRFGNYHDVTTLYDKSFADEDNPLHRHCTQDVNDDMRRKAVAYYKVAYERARLTAAEQGRIMSFPWIAWDILREVKMSSLQGNADALENISSNDFYSTLSAHISAYCGENRVHFEKDLQRLKGTRAVNVYCRVYDGCGKWRRLNRNLRPEGEKDQIGLSELVFFACGWARVSHALAETPLRDIHVAILLIQFATAQLPGNKTMYIDQLPLSDALDVEQSEGLVERSGRRTVRDPGQLLAHFFQYLGARAFRRLPSLCFDDMGIQAMFFEDEWVPLHRAARGAFYSMVFSNRFESLKLRVEENRPLLPDVVREDSAFTIELPGDLNLDTVRDALIAKCQLADLQLRRKAGLLGSSFANRVRVSAMGTARSLRKLRQLLSVTPIYNGEDKGVDVEQLYAVKTRQNIFGKTDLREFEED